MSAKKATTAVANNSVRARFVKGTVFLRVEDKDIQPSATSLNSLSEDLINIIEYLYDGKTVTFVGSGSVTKSPNQASYAFGTVVTLARA